MITFDLKTLPDWETLAQGKCILQIVARAENLIDSNKSDPIEFVYPEPSGETWYFNDTIRTLAGQHSVNFTSNGIEYTGMIRVKAFGMNVLIYQNHYTGDNTNAYDYNSSTWYNEAYRTIVLDEPATGDILAFLEANATKLS